MTTLLQRIRNIWKISSIDKPVFFDENRVYHTFEDKEEEMKKINYVQVPEKPKMAQIIKRKLSIDEEVNKILEE